MLDLWKLEPTATMVSINIHTPLPRRHPLTFKLLDNVCVLVSSFLGLRSGEKGLDMGARELNEWGGGGGMDPPCPPTGGWVGPAPLVKKMHIPKAPEKAFGP